MSAEGFQLFLETAAAARLGAQARVEATAHPTLAGRTIYRVSGSRTAVQDAVNKLRDSVDPIMGGVLGWAVFSSPCREGDEWEAVGQTSVRAPR